MSSSSRAALARSKSPMPRATHLPSVAQRNVHQFFDLTRVGFVSGAVSESYSSSTASSGALTVTSGGSANVAAEIDFSGHYVTSNFHVIAGPGGTVKIFDPPTASQPPTVVSADLALFVNYLAASFPTIAHHGGFTTDLSQPASEQLLLTHPGRLTVSANWAAMGQNGGGPSYWVTEMSAEEYRAFAKECMDWARTAKSDRERDIFEQMALTWTQAAERHEHIAQRTSGTAGSGQHLV